MGTSGLLVLVGIMATAFNLRIGVVAVGPVLEDIRADTGMGSALAGVLTTIPFVCIGVFAAWGGPIVRRIGQDNAITGALVLITVGTILRAGTKEPALLLATTVPIGMGIAIANVAVAAVVKERFPYRPGAATGAWVASLSLGALAITAGIVPLADAVGGWQPAFAISALPAIVAFAIWVLAQHGLVDRATVNDQPRGSAPRRAGLLLGLVFGFQSMCYATMVSWGPAIYTDAGWSEAQAGVVTAVIPLVTVPAGLLMPILSEGRDRRGWVLVSAAMMTFGMVAVAVSPTSAPWVWITLFGFGNGAIFALSLTLALDIGRNPDEVAGLTSWTLSVGFLLASAAPVLVGLVRDMTGGFAVPIALVGLVGFGSGLTAMLLRPARAPAASTTGLAE